MEQSLILHYLQKTRKERELNTSITPVEQYSRDAQNIKDYESLLGMCFDDMDEQEKIDCFSYLSLLEKKELRNATKKAYFITTALHDKTSPSRLFSYNKSRAIDVYDVLSMLSPVFDSPRKDVVVSLLSLIESNDTDNWLYYKDMPEDLLKHINLSTKSFVERILIPAIEHQEEIFACYLMDAPSCDFTNTDINNAIQAFTTIPFSMDFSNHNLMSAVGYLMYWYNEKRSFRDYNGREKYYFILKQLNLSAEYKNKALYMYWNEMKKSNKSIFSFLLQLIPIPKK